MDELITGDVKEPTVVTAATFTLDELGEDLLLPTEYQEGSTGVVGIFQGDAVGECGHIDFDGVGAAPGQRNCEITVRVGRSRLAEPGLVADRDGDVRDARPVGGGETPDERGIRGMSRRGTEDGDAQERENGQHHGRDGGADCDQHEANLPRSPDSVGRRSENLGNTSGPSGDLGPCHPNCHISLLLRYRSHEAGQASGADRPVGIVDDPDFGAHNGAAGREYEGLPAHMSGRR